MLPDASLHPASASLTTRTGKPVRQTLRSKSTLACGAQMGRSLLLGFMCAGLLVNSAQAQDDLHVWREFVSLLRSGAMTAERIRPHEELENARQRLLGYLDIIRQQALPEEWETDPEVIRRDSLQHYIISLTTNQQRVPYCFSFLTEGNRWYFRHLEAVFIRLDTISTFPASVFPDLSPQQKSWMRAEVYWSFVVLNVYLPAARDQGKQYALNLLKDGGGYFLGAKTWVPFVDPRRAFILYLCWEQNHLRNNDVVLVSLSDTAAVVQIQSLFFAVYDIAGHLKPVISAQDYRDIFETIWQDRAKKAGWSLEIKYGENYLVSFNFHKQG